MQNLDHSAVAAYAAGIADAFACIASDGSRAASRYGSLAKGFGGHFGIMQEIGEAAASMERFRVRHGAGAAWGGELPYLYDVWDAIAEALWAGLGKAPVDSLVSSALGGLMKAGTR